MRRISAGRKVEVMWLTGRLVPDHSTIADIRKGLGSSQCASGEESHQLARSVHSLPMPHQVLFGLDSEQTPA